jgi:hypothetical protein
MKSEILLDRFGYERVDFLEVAKLCAGCRLLNDDWDNDLFLGNIKHLVF